MRTWQTREAILQFVLLTPLEQCLDVHLYCQDLLLLRPSPLSDILTGTLDQWNQPLQNVIG